MLPGDIHKEMKVNNLVRHLPDGWAPHCDGGQTRQDPEAKGEGKTIEARNKKCGQNLWDVNQLRVFGKQFKKESDGKWNQRQSPI